LDFAFDTTWHFGLLYKLSELKIFNCLIKLISYFLSQREFRVSVEDEMSTPRNIQARVPQGSFLSPTLYSIYINYTPQKSGVYLGIFIDGTCIYATDRKKCYVFRKLQRGLTAI
jgi:hypothetical protein